MSVAPLIDGRLGRDGPRHVDIPLSPRYVVVPRGAGGVSVRVPTLARHSWGSTEVRGTVEWWSS